MIKLLKRIFGDESIIKQAADGIYNGVDKSFYTDEEKAGGFLDLLRAYEPFKLAQRLLMLVIIIPYSLVCLAGAGMLVTSGFVDPALGKQVEESARVMLELMNDQLGDLALMVAVFYFGGGAAEGVVDRFKKKASTRSSS